MTYNYANIFDAEIIIPVQANGEQRFILNKNYPYPYFEVSFIQFLDGSGQVVEATDGFVTIQAAVGGQFVTIDGGRFHVTRMPDYPPFHVGNSEGGRVVFEGVTGAVSLRLGFRHSGTTMQPMYDTYTSAENRNTRRLRVDVGQTGFFEGREFRTFYEFDIPSGGQVTGRFSCPVDFILFAQSLTVDSGGIRMTTRIGGTPSGTFGTALPIIGKNSMSSRPLPYYASQATVFIGGSVTGGTVVDVARVISAGATAQESTVGGQVSDERGLPAVTAYVTLESIGNGNTTGVYSSFWEERP